jgi:2-(1,2-epoxy-1,2-dihydrophenyl)acetyl-CoA isomerase
MYESIQYEVSEGIATITFDRPDKLNAYTPEMGEEVVAAFAQVLADDSARVVILTGAGRAFCAGVDMDRLKAHMSGEVTSGPKLGEEAFVRSFPNELARFPKPVIAAINGPAYGVGVTMTLGCDVRIAAQSAVLGLNFTRIGLLPGLGSSHHLPRLVGLGKASELVLSGGKLTADEACDVGLVQRVVADELLASEARKLATAMAQVRPEVLAAAKSALRHGAEAPLADAIAEEQRLSADLNRARAKRDAT